MLIDLTVYDRRGKPLAFRTGLAPAGPKGLAREILRLAAGTPGAHEVQATAGALSISWVVRTALNARRLWDQLLWEQSGPPAPVEEGQPC